MQSDSFGGGHHLSSRITLGDLLMRDQRNIEARYNKFIENGIAELFNRMFV